MPSEIWRLRTRLEYATDRLAPEEWLRRWSKLYARCFNEDGSWRASVDDAWAATDLGTAYGLSFHHYRMAIELAERLLLHPEIEALSDERQIEVYGRLAQALVLLGHVDRGVSVFATAMGRSDPESRNLNRDIAAYVLNVLYALGDNEPSDLRVKALVTRLISSWQGHDRVVQAVLEATCIGEVRQFLESTGLRHFGLPHPVPGADVAIWNEWDRITCHPSTGYMTPEKARASYRLFQMGLDGGTWRVTIDDAAMVARTAIVVSFHTRRFEDALPYIEKYLEHPDLANAEIFNRWELDLDIAVARAMTGDVASSVFLIDKLRVQPYEKPRLPWCFALRAIQSICTFMSRRKLDPRLHELAGRIASAKWGNKEIAAAVNASQTYGRLNKALNGLWRRD